jgi:hypothetical protein
MSSPRSLTLIPAAGVGVALALGLGLAGCGGGGGGGGTASTAAAATSGTAAGATAGTTTGGGASAAAVAAVTSVRLPGDPVLAGDIPVVFKLTDPASAPADVEVAISADNGATWQAATPAATSAGLTALATAPAPGAEHTFTWSSPAEVPGTAQVLVRVSFAGGSGALVAGPAVVDNAPLSTTVRLNRRPYLQLTGQTSTVIMWRTETSTDTVVEYGETAALGQTAGDPNAREQAHSVTLTGLRPGTAYTYRIVSGGQPVTLRETFRTAPDPTTGDVSFLAFGDSGSLAPAQLALAGLMAHEQSDFVIHTGDVIYPYGGLGNGVGDYNDRFFHPYEAFLSHEPVFPVIGNHDLIALLGQPFKQAFTLPDNGSSLGRELYFSFEWGDTKFIALETTALFLVPFGEHMRWLENELQTNQRKWVIVYMHVPLYSSGAHGDNAILQQVLEPLFERNHVDLVITGHDHDYERTVPIKQFNHDPAYPGLVHVVTGGGGADLRDLSPNSRTAVAVKANHYVRFHIHGDTLSGEAVDTTGQVIDAFTVQNVP